MVFILIIIIKQIVIIIRFKRPRASVALERRRFWSRVEYDLSSKNDVINLLN